MKKFKLLSLICFSLLMCFVFAACGFGSYDLEFVLPDGTVYKTYTYGPNDATLKSYTSAPSIIGYNFKGWSPTQELEYVITVPYSINTNKLYAKYEINSDMFYSYSTINYNGMQETLNIGETLQNNYYILINDNSASSSISRIEVIANNSSFIVKSSYIRNANAKLLQDSSSSNSIIQINEQASIQTSYVLEVEALNNGDFTIIIN